MKNKPSRIKLKAKKTGDKKIQLKRKTMLKTEISDLFDFPQTLYYSGFALTNNDDIMLFFIDQSFIEKNNLTNNLKQFNLNENDLRIKFDNQNILRPHISGDILIFPEIGNVKKKKIDWFVSNYPKCAFYQITEWFGKATNTLLIVLREPFGKVVGVVKTKI